MKALIVFTLLIGTVSAKIHCETSRFNRKIQIGKNTVTFIEEGLANSGRNIASRELATISAIRTRRSNRGFRASNCKQLSLLLKTSNVCPNPLVCLAPR